MVRWSEVCKPKAIGGLGIKSMKDMNLALVAKLSWRFLTNCDGIWAQVIRKKYIKPSLAETSLPSPIWRSIKRGVKEVVASGTSWVLGNGTSVRFWADVWIGDESLEGLALSHISDEEREARVCDFWDHGTGWIWSTFSYKLPSCILLKIAGITVLEGVSHPDTISWRRTSNGEFSVASAYAMIREPNPVYEMDAIVYKKIWKLHARFSSWLAMKGCILTNAERVRRHMSIDARCSRCQNPSESLLHIFRDCRCALQVWSTVSIPGSQTGFFDCDYASWIRNNILDRSVFCDGIDWGSFFALAIWWLWKWRNLFIFRKSEFHGDKGAFILLNAKECRAAMMKSLLDKGLHTKRLEGIAWVKPPEGCIKINTDGSVRDDRASAAGVLRDHVGGWVGGFVHNIGCCSVPAAELWGWASGGFVSKQIRN